MSLEELRARIEALIGGQPDAEARVAEALRDLAVEPVEFPPAAGWSAVGLLGDGGRYDLSLFRLRAGQHIPAHDHPELRGWMRVLSGRVRVVTWRWTERPFAELVGDEVLEPGALVSIGPDTVHQLEAEEATTFLDLFAPYYDPPRGRGCSYFRPRRAGQRWELL